MAPIFQMLNLLKVHAIRPIWFHLSNLQYLYLRPNAILHCSLHFARRSVDVNNVSLFCFFFFLPEVVKPFSFFQRPILLQHLFNVYGRSPKVVKQVLLSTSKVLNFDYWITTTVCSLRRKIMQCIHWHIPNLVRNLGSSCSEMLAIIHNPPEGSEELVTLVLPSFLLIHHYALLKHGYSLYSLSYLLKDIANSDRRFNSFSRTCSGS